MDFKLGHYPQIDCRENHGHNHFKNNFTVRSCLNQSNLTANQFRSSRFSTPRFLDTMCYFPIRERSFIWPFLTKFSCAGNVELR